MVGDDPVAHVVGCTPGAVTTGRALGHLVDHRAHQVDLVDVVDTLEKAGDALDAHAGVDILARQRAQDRELLLGRALAALVLHEDEVPDFDIPVLVGLRPALDAVVRAAVVVDLRARPARSRDTHRPVVVGHAAALDPLGRQSCHLLPQSDGFVVVIKDGGPESFRVHAVAAVGDRLRE